MNKRARNRLIIVTALILVGAGVVLYASGALTTGAAYSISVDKAVKDTSQIGKRIRVTGTVVPGSWDKKSNPMVFSIAEEGTDNGPQLKIVYSGNVPSTFGNDTVAIVTGTLEKGAVLKADDMITKCPSKYQSASAAPLTLDQFLKSKSSMVGKPVEVLGFLKAGSLKPAGTPRFLLAAAQGTEDLPVSFAGKMPAGSTDGTSLVVTGKLGADGVFAATGVGLGK